MVGFDSFWPLYPNLSQSTARNKRETHNSGSVLCTQCRDHLKQSHNHESSQPTFTPGAGTCWCSFPVSSPSEAFFGSVMFMAFVKAETHWKKSVPQCVAEGAWRRLKPRWAGQPPTSRSSGGDLHLSGAS